MVKLIDLAAAAIGFGLIVAGVARLSVAAALIVAGALLLAGALYKGRAGE